MLGAISQPSFKMKEWMVKDGHENWLLDMQVTVSSITGTAGSRTVTAVYTDSTMTVADIKNGMLAAADCTITLSKQRSRSATAGADGNGRATAPPAHGLVRQGRLTSPSAPLQNQARGADAQRGGRGEQGKAGLRAGAIRYLHHQPQVSRCLEHCASTSVSACVRCACVSIRVCGWIAVRVRASARVHVCASAWECAYICMCMRTHECTVLPPLYILPLPPLPLPPPSSPLLSLLRNCYLPILFSPSSPSVYLLLSHSY